MGTRGLPLVLPYVGLKYPNRMNEGILPSRAPGENQAATSVSDSPCHSMS